MFPFLTLAFLNVWLRILRCSQGPASQDCCLFVFGVFETGPHLHLKSDLKLVAQAGLELVASAV